MGEELADDLSDTVYACQPKAVDERDRPPVALLGYHDDCSVTGPLNRVDARPVVAGVALRALRQLESSRIGTP
jgi:hypothetical protein